MFSKSALAIAALSSILAVGVAAPAKADPTISFGVGFGSGPWDGGYGDAGYGDAGYGDVGYGDGPYFHHRHRPMGFEGGPWPRYGYRISCGEGANMVRARGFRGVQAVDCSAPVYEYRGWKHGAPFSIQVSMRGNVLGADRLGW